jgi:diketogulonate reductase-like aldo/keto reductase
MASIPLNDGTHIPWLGFGTGTALYKRDSSHIITRAIANGITHLDGAQWYGNEQSLGAGIKASGKPRSELYVVTKLKGPLAGQTVKQSLAGSLERLGLDYVDLFLIHVPTEHEGRLREVWKEMEGVQRDGMTKSIGVSNFIVKDFEEILEEGGVVPAVNQASQVTICDEFDDLQRF